MAWPHYRGFVKASNLVLVVWLLGGSTGLAKQWAREMFDHTSHDFGTVARGAKVEHRFTLKNKYKEDIQIERVSSSCGCATTRFTKRPLKTGEEGEIVVAVDTRSFLGRKDTTLTVVFAPPFPAEVQLHTHCFIRRDIVFCPGLVQFSSVRQGRSVTREVSISYAGRHDWRIRSVNNNNPHLEVKLSETSREFGQVKYNMSVRLKDDAPLGYIKDQLVLVTDDPDRVKSRVPIAVEGIVVPAIDVRPSSLMIGILRPGEAATRQLVAHAKTPFRVVAVSCADKRFKCDVLSEGARTLHQIAVTFTAGKTSGKATAKVQIRTDLGKGPDLEVTVHAQVVPPAAGS